MVDGALGAAGAGTLGRRAPSGPARRPPGFRPPVSTVRTGARRLWALPLAAHIAALAAGLVAVAPFLHLGDVFTSDEGSYAIQVRALDRGSWEYDDRTAVHDPDGRWFPLRNAEREDGRWYAYVDHPAYPLALLGATRLLGGTVGLYAWGLLGVLGVAAAAWKVAAEFDDRASRGAFWIAASGPVVVNGYLVLAHAPSAALAGMALLAGLRLRRAPSQGWAAVVLVATGAGVLLRAEAVLFGLALAAAMALVPVPVAGGRPPLRTRLGLPAVVVSVVVAAALVEQAWIEAIIGGDHGEGGVRGEDVATTARSGAGILDFLGGRVDGAWHSLLQGAHNTPPESVLVMIALTMVAFAAWAAARRRPGWPRDVTVGLGVAALLYAVRWAAGPDQSMTGLLAAWPVVLLGLLVLVVARHRAPGTALPAVAAGLFAAAVLATQYRFGGGFEWGGRFFSPAAVPLAVLACLGVRQLLAALPGRRGPVVALVGLLAALPVATGFAVVRDVRPLLGDVVDDVEASGASLVITHSPALPPAAWRTYPDVTWLVMPRSAMAEAVARVRQTSGARIDVVLYGTWADELRDAFPGFRDVTAAGAARLGWRALTLPAAP